MGDPACALLAKYRRGALGVQTVARKSAVARSADNILLHVKRYGAGVILGGGVKLFGVSSETIRGRGVVRKPALYAERRLKCWPACC